MAIREAIALTISASIPIFIDFEVTIRGDILWFNPDILHLLVWQVYVRSKLNLLIIF